MIVKLKTLFLLWTVLKIVLLCTKDVKLSLDVLDSPFRWYSCTICTIFVIVIKCLIILRFTRVVLLSTFNSINPLVKVMP